jgi:hypothetical protein
MSSTDHGTVSARQDLRLIGPDDMTVPLACTMTYSRHDPYAVTMSLAVGTGAPVEWTFSRDLLAAALFAPVGLGDVRAWPSRPSTGGGERTLAIELGSPGEHARFEASAMGIGTFLAESYDLVPEGQEGDSLNLDAELAELLSQA